MKTLWKGSISFGLVNIPIRMYTATQSHTLNLDMLRKGDLSKVKYMRVSADDGKEIPYQDIVKGYKYTDGSYVVLSDKDFENANVEKTHTLDLLHFVDEKDVNTIYYEKPYYLEPDKSGTKSYALLREAIKKSKKVGIARFVLKNREHIGIIKLYEDVIVLNQIRFQNEIKSFKDLQLPEEKGITSKEVDMAIALIKQLNDKFKPKEYKDTYFEELQKIIEMKAKGKKIKPKGKAPKPTQAKSLMTLLKSSLKDKAA